jgi:hypothetical protein
MIQIATIVLVVLLLPLNVHASESDVHFGLTKWLALKAGFTEQQAVTIAMGDQRSDSGIMDSVELALEYACLEKHADASDVVKKYHFAGDAKPHSTPQQRAVAAGSLAARRGVEQVLAMAAQGKADFMLLKLGEALHLLQDSWAYQGVPDTPDFADKAIQCSSELSWAAPAARGGWNSHKADMAKNWPADVKAMAAVSYEVLTRYAPVAGRKRQAADANQIQQQLDGFIQASTKTEKRAWFRAQGIDDESFLSMTSLPDGAQAITQTWQGTRMPALTDARTRQYQVPEDAKQFFDRFFSAWLSTDKPESAIATDIHSAAGQELAARLKLWRMRDHGAVAALAHVAGPLTKKQRQTVDRLARAPHVFVRYEKLEDAYFPLLQQGPGASPMLPYVIHVLDGERMIAVTKLRHVPYDELAIIAQKDGTTWRAVRLISAVSH